MVNEAFGDGCRLGSMETRIRLIEQSLSEPLSGVMNPLGSAFCRAPSFGTAGLRGPIGAGPHARTPP